MGYHIFGVCSLLGLCLCFRTQTDVERPARYAADAAAAAVAGTRAGELPKPGDAAADCVHLTGLEGPSRRPLSWACACPPKNARRLALPPAELLHMPCPQAREAQNMQRSQTRLPVPSLFQRLAPGHGVACSRSTCRRLDLSPVHAELAASRV